MIARRLARPLLAASFINGGIDTLRNPGPRVKLAEPVVEKVAEPAPLPGDTDQLVKVNAVVQVVGGALLALGKFRRLAAVALALSLVPTTLAGHPFWEKEDPAEQSQQRTQFAKNMGLLGGLILAALDTEGAPSLGWRARRAAHKAREALPIG